MRQLTSGPLEGYSGGTPAFRTPDCHSSSPLLKLKNALITKLTSRLVPHKASSQGISTNPVLLLNKYKQKGSRDAAQILPENDFLSFHCHFFSESKMGAVDACCKFGWANWRCGFLPRVPIWLKMNLKMNDEFKRLISHKNLDRWV